MDNAVRKNLYFFRNFYVGATHISSVDALQNTSQTPTGERKKEIHVAGVPASDTLIFGYKVLSPWESR